ncbi:protein kinase [Actinokineospora soli]|uniref:Protein kinase n=1 Tax=Actinokineospora soli TaxID=1048753 RepID=A0ABW2TXM7_9PSEU
MAHLAQIMESSQQAYRHVIVILDCCHSGAAFNWVNTRPISASDIDRGVLSVNESRCVLAACRPEQLAQESGEPVRGAFTETMIDGMLDSAVDHEGKITLLSLYDYVARTLPEDMQTPVFKGDVAGTVVLGTGFEPRRGAPIPESESGKILAKGTAFVDEYYNLQHSELFSDRQHRLSVGADRCARELAAKIEWFRETEGQLPDIKRNSNWTSLTSRIEDFRLNLTMIEPGQVTPVGTVEKLIGQGGYGKVWKVVGEAGTVAMKVFHGDQLQDQMRVQRFRNGYNGMRKLDHPRIVKVHELLAAPYAFTMDYIDGDNLRSLYLDREDQIAVLRMLSQIAETIQHAHSQGVKHRDIKPENIIVTMNDSGEYVPFLTDFDLAYLETNRTITTNLGVGGVINYAAPEQLYKPSALAARAETVDVFALGQLMYFVVTGEDPVAQSETRNAQKFRRSVSEWIDERAAQQLMELYTESTKSEPGERLESVNAFTMYLARAETYIQEATGNDSIAENRFCARVAHSYGGVNSFKETESTANFMTLSGQLEVVVRKVGVQPGKSGDLATIELEFSTVGSMTIPHFKSGATGRNAINERLTRSLKPFPNATRRPGTKGTYQVYVVIKEVGFNTKGLAQVSEILRTSIGAIEQW